MKWIVNRYTAFENLLMIIMKILNLDPRLTTFTLFIGIIGLFLFPNVLLTGVFFIFFLILYETLPIKKNKQFLIILVGSVVMLYALNLIFHFLTEEQLYLSISRIWAFNTAFTWYYLATSPENLTKLLVWLRIPYRWSWTISSAFRFITLFATETIELRNAHLVRGIPLDGNILQRVKYLPSLIIPLTYRIHLRRQQFAEALFARGWIPIGEKSFLHPLKFNEPINIIISVYVGIFIVFVIVLTYLRLI